MSNVIKPLFGGSSQKSSQQSTQQSMQQGFNQSQQGGFQAGNQFNLSGGNQQGTSMSSSSGSSAMDSRLMKRFLDNIKQSEGVAKNLGAREIAQLGGNFNDAVGLTRSTALNGPGMQTTGAAISAAQAAGGYRPDQVQARGLLDQDIGAYMNPFLQNVAGNVMGDLDRTRMMAQTGNDAAAARAGAFGGSRHGVLGAETNRNFFDRAGNTLSGLYSQGFDTAMGMAGSDVDRSMMADQLNQAAGLQGNAQQLSAAGLLGNLGNQQQQMGLQGADALAQMGFVERDQQQAVLDAVRNLPLEQQAIINEALGINPAGGSGTVSSSSGGSSSQNTGTSFGVGLGQNIGANFGESYGENMGWGTGSSSGRSSGGSYGGIFNSMPFPF
jgi:hypothetical protein